ncbi:MAG: hypothetical protein Aurels2KO_13520 [Aureliella sp.]
MAVLILCRNYVAHSIAVRAGSYFLGNDVSVGQINIGWRAITVNDLAIRERRLDGVPQLTVQQIMVEPTLWRGIRTGVWTERISISKVDAYVRFDEEGKLLSHFPASGETKEKQSQPIVIPTRFATVSETSVTISQDGKEPFRIGGIQCELLADQKITMRARVDELLGSSLGLDSELDAETLAGKTRFELQPLLVDSHSLGELPLAPAVLKSIDFSAHIACAAILEHPADDLDLRNHAAALRIDVTEMQGNELAAASSSPRSVEELYSTYLAHGLGDHVSLRAIQRNGNCTLHVSGPVAGGQVSLHAEGNLNATEPQVDASVNVSSVDIGQLAAIAAPDLPISAIANVHGQLKANLREGIVHFGTSLQPELTQICAHDVCVDPISTVVTSRGSFDTQSNQLRGAVDVSTKSTGVDLASLAKLLGVHTLTGRTSFAATAHIPLATVRDPNTISAQAAVDVRGASAEGFQVSPIQLTANLSGGKAQVDLPPVQISLQDAVRRPAQCVANAAQLSDEAVVSLRASASSRLEQAADPGAWIAGAELDIGQVSIADHRLEDFSLSLELASGEAILKPAEIVWRNTRCSFSAQGKVDGTAQIRFDAAPILLTDIALAASKFSSQPLKLSGTARAAGVATLDARHKQFQANGYLHLSDAIVQDTIVGSTRIAWAASPSAVQLQSKSDDFLGGRYACGAMLTSLDWTTTKVVANFSDIPLKRLAAGAKLTTKLAGTLNGELQLDSISSLETIAASGNISTRNCRVGNVPFSFQTTELVVDQGKITVAASSEIAGGSIQINAQSTIDALQHWQQNGAAPEHLPVQATIRSTPILAQPLIAIFDRRGQMRDIRAACSVSVNRDEAAIRDGIWCNATATIDYLGYRSAIVANRLRTDILARPTGIQLRNIGGKIGGGAVQGEVDLALGGNLNGRYRLAVQGVNLRRALSPLPDAARSVSGTASIAASGRIGDLTTANVRMKASNVVAGGLAIREMRMPLTADYRLKANRASWHTRGATVQVGGGTISLDSEGSMARQLASFTSNIKIARVDTTKMLRGKSLNAGVIDGSVNLRARRATAPEDIVGGFHIQLSQMQGFELPGFDQLLQIAKMPSFTMQKLGKNDLGIIDGRIGGGLVHIDDATLSKSGIMVLMNGTSTLSGRLNLDVTAITNPSGPADGLVDLANSPLMLAAPAPVALIAKANDALKDRVIYVAVAGVAARPTLHVQPGKSLSQDALRFVLSTAIGNQSANMAVRRPSQESNR